MNASRFEHTLTINYKALKYKNIQICLASHKNCSENDQNITSADSLLSNKYMMFYPQVSLHQQDLIKIENLDVLCRHLKILYLQNNII